MIRSRAQGTIIYRLSIIKYGRLLSHGGEALFLCRRKLELFRHLLSAAATSCGGSWLLDLMGFFFDCMVRFPHVCVDCESTRIVYSVKCGTRLYYGFNKTALLSSEV